VGGYKALGGLVGPGLPPLLLLLPLMVDAKRLANGSADSNELTLP
jgi:hypothetical protein